MKDWKFKLNEYAVINQSAKQYLPQHVGELVQIFELKIKGINDYTVKLQDGDFVFVKENELNKVDEEIVKIYNAILNGRWKVLHTPSNELVTILTFDLLHNQTEIRYEDSSMEVVNTKTLKLIENEVDSVGEDIKTTVSIEDIFRTFFSHYDNKDGTYTVPKQLLINMLNEMYEVE